MCPNYPYGYPRPPYNYIPPNPNPTANPNPNASNQTPPSQPTAPFICPPAYTSSPPRPFPSVFQQPTTPHVFSSSNATPGQAEVVPNYGMATSSPWISIHPNSELFNDQRRPNPAMSQINNYNAPIEQYHWECISCPSRRNGNVGSVWCGVCKGSTQTAWAPGP